MCHNSTIIPRRARFRGCLLWPDNSKQRLEWAAAGLSKKRFICSDKGWVCFEWQIKDISEGLRIVSSEKWSKCAFAR